MNTTTANFLADYVVKSWTFYFKNEQSILKINSLFEKITSLHITKNKIYLV